jgi:hypothetical protein
MMQCIVSRADCLSVTIEIAKVLQSCCDGAPELSIAASTVGDVPEQVEQLHPALYWSVRDHTGGISFPVDDPKRMLTLRFCEMRWTSTTSHRPRFSSKQQPNSCGRGRRVVNNGPVCSTICRQSIA